MNKIFLALAVGLLVIYGRNVYQKQTNGYDKVNSLSVVTVENDVIMGNTLPRYGTLCEDAPVQGNPHDGFATHYILSKGTRVRLHEQGGDGHSWVMIEPAYWIRMSALCDFQR